MPLFRDSLLFSVLLLGTVACTTTHPLDEDPIIPDVGTIESAVFGSEGGTLAVGDLAVVIPSGAVPDGTEVTVTVSEEETPNGFTAYSPVIRYEPEGLVFERPVQIEIPFEGDPDVATVFLTLEGQEAYGALTTRTERGIAFASTNHFSRAFVGTACSGDNCCGRATADLDVLLMVDNSNSMQAEQEALAAELPRFVEALATGDVDGDGVQDFPAVRSLQIGSVSSDMGSGGFSLETCDDAMFGDDGVVRTMGNPALSGCDATYPGVQSFTEGDDAASFAQDVSCVATMGINGCGFEQQLDAILKAVTPSSSDTRFSFSTVGHADGANSGLVRDDSVLAVVAITDENDCSASDPDIFNRASVRYPGELNLRCFANPDALHGIDRYADGLLATREDPRKLVFSLIGGIPTDLAGASPDEILSDSRMAERVDPDGRSLVPSCIRDGNIAFPPTRLVRTAQEVSERGAAISLQSLCQDNFQAVVSGILSQVSARLAGRCR